MFAANRDLQRRTMPRKPRFEYPGAMYHVMGRRDRREDIKEKLHLAESIDLMAAAISCAVALSSGLRLFHRLANSAPLRGFACG
jgi:hypothetical protein